MIGRGKWIIWLLTVLFLGAAVLCGSMDPLPVSEETEAAPFWMELTAGEQTEKLQPWQSPEDQWYVFLPGFGALSQLRLRIEPGYSLSLGDISLSDGMTCEGFSLGERFCLTVSREGKEEKQLSLTVLRSGGVPALYVDVRSGDMDFLNQNKNYEEPGSYRLYTQDGAMDHSGLLRAVSGRGNSTWDQEKKPYNLELSVAADLLGMGQAENWVLLANHYDPSHIRNQIVFDYARDLGLSYSPESKWVDLYLNGEYAGLYMLCERNEIHPQRVDIAGDQSFLVSVERARRLDDNGVFYVSTEGGTALQVRQSSGDYEALQALWQSAENAILASDGIDPVTGKHWTELIDLDSWAKKFLIEELFGNPDAGFYSQFFYGDGTGKIYAGPVWDYDVAMGSSMTWPEEDPQMLFAARPHLWDDQDSPLYYALYQKDEFRQRVIALYEQQGRQLLQRLLDQGIDAYAAAVSQAAEMNGFRWPGTDTEGSTQEIRGYMVGRMDFLDSLWLEGTYYHSVQVRVPELVMACYQILPGQTMAQLPDFTSYDNIIIEGWYDAATDAPYDFSQSVTEDRFLYLRQRDLAVEAREAREQGGLTAVIKYVPSCALVLLFGAAAAAEGYRQWKQTKTRKESRCEETV